MQSLVHLDQDYVYNILICCQYKNAGDPRMQCTTIAEFLNLGYKMHISGTISFPQKIKSIGEHDLMHGIK